MNNKRYLMTITLVMFLTSVINIIDISLIIDKIKNFNDSYRLFLCPLMQIIICIFILVYVFMSDKRLFRLSEKINEENQDNIFYARKHIEFKPLMWSDIQSLIDRVKKSTEELYVVPVQHFDSGSKIYGIYICKSDNEFSIEVSDLEDSEKIFKSFDFSEEGYVQAVEWARELFLDENNE